MDGAAKIVLTGFAGTTLMTAASGLMSKLMGENYCEPEHLGTLIGRSAPGLSPQAKKIAGCGAHYAVGLLFAAVYVQLWSTKKIEHNFKSGLILGILTGIFGICVWKSTLTAHPLPPSLSYRHFYLQLIPAHIVFSITATLAYRILSERR